MALSVFRSRFTLWLLQSHSENSYQTRKVTGLFVFHWLTIKSEKMLGFFNLWQIDFLEVFHFSIFSFLKDIDDVFSEHTEAIILYYIHSMYNIFWCVSVANAVLQIFSVNYFSLVFICSFCSATALQGFSSIRYWYHCVLINLLHTCFVSLENQKSKTKIDQSRNYNIHICEN